jgi:hypothetical protein
MIIEKIVYVNAMIFQLHFIDSKLNYVGIFGETI